MADVTRNTTASETPFPLAEISSNQTDFYLFMSSDTTYYFSKRTFLFTSLFIVAISVGLIYFSLLFYPDAWQYSLLFSSPLLIILYILPEYLRTFYFLITQKPALILTKEKLIDNFKNKEYKWSEIQRIDLMINEGRAPGGYIALYLRNSEDVIKIPDVKLEGKKFDILQNIVSFHNKYGKTIEPCYNTNFG